jgi:hypothetical protein
MVKSFFNGFGLRLASGGSGARRREAFSESQPERNAAAEPQTEAAADAAIELPLVTRARFVQWNGRG